jgi:glycerol-3-phosphate acyltransferase PlsY
MTYILSFMLGSVFGMIPFSYILGLLRGVDLSKTGSGNIGATNLGRTLGFGFFAIGFVLDALKGVIPILLSYHLFETGTLAGAGAILGHVFNPFFGFHGGKGVATTIGVGLTLITKSFALGLGIWLIVYLITFFVSLASLCFAVALPVFSILLDEGTTGDRLLFIAIAILIIYAHRANIGRLIKRKEPKTFLWRKK